MTACRLLTCVLAVVLLTPAVPTRAQDNLGANRLETDHRDAARLETDRLETDRLDAARLDAARRDGEPRIGERGPVGWVLRVPMPSPATLGAAGAPMLIEHGLSVTRRDGPLDRSGRAGLLLACRRGTLELLALDLDWPPGGSPVGEVDVTVQLDATATPERWRVLGNAYAPPDPAALLERLRLARTFALQVATPAGERELSFDLHGVAEAAGNLRSACPF
ncbi:hypothetical protein RHODGE_RHODGE_03138 [Rhodoplanes serenus]|uniref:Uncharacterized protein n=2 Tax=Rhodoplanes serenus TaxID=200615 RepID=A0A447CW53_9BRAD|nr:hypothetical protein RHODGE_RHODGE_03138 [Rhodoplanes serenus]